jgi:hypothetical protein
MTLRELRLRALGFLLLSMSLGAAPEAPAPAAKRPDPIRDPVCVGWNEGWVVYRYSPTQNQWLMWTSPNSPKPVTALSAVGSHHAAVVDPRKQCSGWTFNLHTQKWEQIPPSPFGGPPGATATVMITFIDDKLLAWGQPGGGKQGGIFDTATKQWNPMAVSPVPSRFRAATAKFGGKWLVWGGYGHNNPDKPRAFGALADGALYDIDKNAWEIIPGPPAPMPNYGYVWATWNDSLIVFGGRTGRAISRVGAIYDTTSKTWEAIVECPFEVGHQSTRYGAQRSAAALVRSIARGGRRRQNGLLDGCGCVRPD